MGQLVALEPRQKEPRQKDAQQWVKSRGWKDREGFPGEGALRTFYIPLAFMQRCVCWHTVSPGALSEWKTHTGLRVLITVMRRVSFMPKQGVLPDKRKRQVQRLKEQHSRCFG